MKYFQIKSRVHFFSDDDVQGAAGGLLPNSSTSSAQARDFLREIGFLGQAHLSPQHNPFETDDPEVNPLGLFSFSFHFISGKHL